MTRLPAVFQCHPRSLEPERSFSLRKSQWNGSRPGLGSRGTGSSSGSHAGVWAAPFTPRSSLHTGAHGVLAGAVLGIGDTTGDPGPVTLGRLPGLCFSSCLCKNLLIYAKRLRKCWAKRELSYVSVSLTACGFLPSRDVLLCPSRSWGQWRLAL